MASCKIPEQTELSGKIIELLSNFPGFPHSRALRKREKNPHFRCFVVDVRGGEHAVFETVAMAVSQGGHEDHVICVFLLNRGYPPSIFRDMMNHRMP